MIGILNIYIVITTLHYTCPSTLSIYPLGQRPLWKLRVASRIRLHCSHHAPAAPKKDHGKLVINSSTTPRN